MKKQENTTIEIEGKEFIVSTSANDLLLSYIKHMRNKYRFNSRVRRELLRALRDLLLELPPHKSKTIQAATAQSIIRMAGETFDNQSALQPAVNKLTQSYRFIKRWTLRNILTESTRKKIFYSLSIVMLLPVGIGIGSLEVFMPNFHGTNLDPSVINTTLGPVRTFQYSLDTDSTESNLVDPRSYSVESTIIVALLLSALFYALAQRSSRTKFIAALLAVTLVASWTISENERLALNETIESFPSQAYVLQYNSEGVRSEGELDTLYACGAGIRYVFLERNDGIFYTLRDAGYALRTELEGNSAPSSEALCKAYDQLRKEIGNDAIVLMTYIHESDGTIRPYNPSAPLNQKTISKELARMRYGFFVKASK